MGVTVSHSESQLEGRLLGSVVALTRISRSHCNELTLEGLTQIGRCIPPWFFSGKLMVPFSGRSSKLALRSMQTTLRLRDDFPVDSMFKFFPLPVSRCHCSSVESMQMIAFATVAAYRFPIEDRPVGFVLLAATFGWDLPD